MLATIAFNGTTANQPIINTLIRQYDIEVNILNGSVETIGGESVGQLQLELSGADVASALEYLHRLDIAVEVEDGRSASEQLVDSNT
ncbi:NIL domain-containing protein [Leptolyngbya sp. PL-A3]